MSYLKIGDELPTKGKGSKLTPKMKNFIDEFFVDFIPAKAVVRAGYKAKNPNKLGAELILHPLVSAEIQKRQEERREKTEVRAEYLLNQLISIIDSASEKTQDKLRAIELAGKSIALWKDRQEVSGPDGKAIEMEQRTKEDVADFTSTISRLAKRSGEGEITEFPKRGSEGAA